MAYHYYTPDPEWNGIFRHLCEEPGCDNWIQYDDEPKCYKHSPDEGSSVRGYSARLKEEEFNEILERESDA